MHKNDKVFEGELIIFRAPQTRPPYVTHFYSFNDAWKAYVESGLTYAEYSNKAEVISNFESGFGEDDEEIERLREQLSEFADDEPIIEADTAANGNPRFYSAAKYTKEDILYEAAADDMYRCKIIYAEKDETYDDFAERIYRETRGHNEPSMSAIHGALPVPAEDWELSVEDEDWELPIEHSGEKTEIKEPPESLPVDEEKGPVQISPVSLEEILAMMEMQPEVTPEGKIKVFDRQRQEYIDNRSLLPDSGEGNWTFNNAAEIFDRLEIYINDYYIHDMEEQLEAGGVTLRGDESLEDLCDYTKEQLEAGIATVSQGELDLAMGIVNPDTVIMPEGFIDQKQKAAEKTNYVLEKLAKAGIEVVTDKSEFDRIIAREDLLSKMHGTLTAEEQRKYFTFDEEDSNKFKEYVAAWQKDNTNPSKLIVVGKVTPVMRVLGISERLIEVEQSTLDKMIRGSHPYPNAKQGHNLSVDDIYAIPSQLADPVMVFKSRTRDDSFVFFTKRKDADNKSILIPLAVDKRKSRVIIHEITSMYGKDNEVGFVKTNMDENNLIYEDREQSLLWAIEKIEELEKLNRKDAEKKLSPNGERFTQIQFLGQRFTDNGTYAPSILTKERLVKHFSSKNPEIQKMVSGNDRNGEINSFVTDKKGFVNPEKVTAIDLYGFEKAKEMWKDGEPGRGVRSMLREMSVANYLLQAETPDIHNHHYQIGKTVYGLAYDDKIYLNPDVMNSEAAVHEYTHLWDNYTQKTNPELWNKGLSIFRGVSLWNDIVNDENYAGIKDDDNLVLSECHARICGKIADSVLQKVLERDGDLKQAEMIDWSKEVDQYIYENFESSRTLSDGRTVKSTGYDAFGQAADANAIRAWFASPMKDLFQRELNPILEQRAEENIAGSGKEKDKIENTASNFKKNFKKIVRERNGISSMATAGLMVKTMSGPEKRKLTESFASMGIKGRDALETTLNAWRNEALDEMRNRNKSKRPGIRRSMSQEHEMGL